MTKSLTMDIRKLMDFDKNKFNAYRKPTDSNFKKFNKQSATNKFQEQ